MNSLRQHIKDFQGKKVLIIGDVMLDHYLSGKVTRISPEAPVPIVNLQTSSQRLGGAANVAVNVAEMGGIPLLCGVIGADFQGQNLIKICAEQGISTDLLFTDESRPTTRKTRVLAGHQQLLRVDEESTRPISDTLTNTITNGIEECLTSNAPDVILFQDYNKGVLTPKIIIKVIAMAQKAGISTVVDPKFENFEAYRGCTLFKPNLKELSHCLNTEIKVDESSLSAAASKVQHELNAEQILITLSEHGVFSKGKDSEGLYPTHTLEVVDVCGAGDAVIAACALGVSAKMSSAHLAILANCVGGIVCESIGVVPVSSQEIEAYLKEGEEFAK